MSEIIFVIEDAAQGGLSASALGHSIFTEGATLQKLKENIRGGVRCHFEEEEDRPRIACLNMVRDESMAI